jgi:GxxExxY protein
MRKIVDPAMESLTERIIGCAFEVSTVLGHGFLETVYARALSHELKLKGLSVREEVEYKVMYKSNVVGRYVADLVVEEAVILELKAIEALNRSHVGQLLNYLAASGLKVGLLLNFGQPRLEMRRVLA